MRPDQKARLAEIEEKLIDVFLEEADPDEWPGAGVPISAQDRDTRNDRTFAKRGAAQTMLIVGAISRLSENTKEALGRDPYGVNEIDEKIKAAEKQAAAAIERIQKDKQAKSLAKLDKAARYFGKH